jgi:hypothetical protein
MNKIVDFEGIGYVAATFPVDSETQAYLVANHTEATTGNVDINGKQLAVKLNEDGTVGFGTGSAKDALLGIIMTYEMDGFAGVQIAGGVDEVPTSAAITGGIKGLAVNAKGEVVAVEGTKERAVVKPSTADSLYASIIL